MKHQILENGNLMLIADSFDIEDLKELKEEHGEHFPADSIEIEFLQDLTSNSELQWISPEEIGALTDAPILGIRRGDNEFEEGESEGDSEEITQAWGWMDYQVKSLQEELLEKGYAILTKGHD